MQKKSTTKDKIASWLKSSIDPITRAYIEKQLTQDPLSLEDAFYKNLEFGTGGVRALMGVGTNRLNCYTMRMAVQGLSHYIRSIVPQKAKVVVCYDSRNNSKIFAEQAARVFAANKIKTYLFKNVRPTPMLSFAVKNLGCIAGIMITASHNPPAYNGFKIYWEDGGQVLPPHDKKIIEEFYKCQEIDNIILSSLEDPLIESIPESFDEKYLQALQPLKLLPLSKTPIKIVYTNLHGAGMPIMIKALNAWGFFDITTVKKQEPLDGNFPYAPQPNPEEKKTLELGIAQMHQTTSDLFIATDPDADRLAVVVRHKKQEHLLTGNQLASIFTYMICKTLKEKKTLSSQSVFIKSIVTTELMKKIVNSFDCTCINVLTGFKYIAEKIHQFELNKESQFIFGAEESYGYLMGTYTRDKDGILAGCLISQITQWAKEQNITLIDLLYKLYEIYGVHREAHVSIIFEDSREGLKKMQIGLNAFRKMPPEKLNEQKVVCFEDLENPNPITRLPRSNVLRFLLEDNTKIIVRPSGTEPKIKIYLEAVEEPSAQNVIPLINHLDTKLKLLAKEIEHFFS